MSMATELQMAVFWIDGKFPETATPYEVEPVPWCVVHDAQWHGVGCKNAELIFLQGETDEPEADCIRRDGVVWRKVDERAS